MAIPTKQDWGKINKKDLDAKHAYDNFYGISTSQAYKLFVEHALYYQEDLLSMPAKPFNYYAPIFADYIASNNAQGDADGASSYLNFIVEMLTRFNNLPSFEVKKKLLGSAAAVANRQAFYEADQSIYGNFLDVYEKIKRYT